MNHMLVFSFGLVCHCRLNDFTAGTIRKVQLYQKENLQSVSHVPVTAVNQKQGINPALAVCSSWHSGNSTNTHSTNMETDVTHP